MEKTELELNSNDKIDCTNLGNNINNNNPETNKANKSLYDNTNKINKVNLSTLNKPKFYVLIYNLSKAKNIGTLIRSASAFGCSQIFVLGSDKKVLKKFYGSQGTAQKSEFVFFDSSDQLSSYCKTNDITIVGVEIGEHAKPVNSHPFKGNTLFVLGNEGVGMNQKQRDLCGENLVYIPQFSNTTASLNVAVAASIVFHHYSLWAKYEEVVYENEKFQVDMSIKQKVTYIKEDLGESENIQSENLSFDNCNKLI